MLSDVLDDQPQISATMTLIATEKQTLAEIHAAIRTQAKQLFEEAIARLDRYHDL